MYFFHKIYIFNSSLSPCNYDYCNSMLSPFSTPQRARFRSPLDSRLPIWCAFTFVVTLVERAYCWQQQSQLLRWKSEAKNVCSRTLTNKKISHLYREHLQRFLSSAITERGLRLRAAGNKIIHLKIKILYNTCLIQCVLNDSPSDLNVSIVSHSLQIYLLLLIISM